MTAIRYIHHGTRPFHLELVTVRLPVGVLPLFCEWRFSGWAAVRKADDTRSLRLFSALPA